MILSTLQHPTSIEVSGGQRLHESLFRSFQILNQVEDLLAKETPPAVVLSIVAELRNAPGKTMTLEDVPVPMMGFGAMPDTESEDTP